LSKLREWFDTKVFTKNRDPRARNDPYFELKVQQSMREQLKGNEEYEKLYEGFTPEQKAAVKNLILDMTGKKNPYLIPPEGREAHKRLIKQGKLPKNY
jgi:hypothetical protein